VGLADEAVAERGQRERIRHTGRSADTNVSVPTPETIIRVASKVVA